MHKLEVGIRESDVGKPVLGPDQSSDPTKYQATGLSRHELSPMYLGTGKEPVKIIR